MRKVSKNTAETFKQDGVGRFGEPVYAGALDLGSEIKELYSSELWAIAGEDEINGVELAAGRTEIKGYSNGRRSSKLHLRNGCGGSSYEREYTLRGLSERLCGSCAKAHSKDADGANLLTWMEIGNLVRAVREVDTAAAALKEDHRGPGSWGYDRFVTRLKDAATVAHQAVRNITDGEYTPAGVASKAGEVSVQVNTVLEETLDSAEEEAVRVGGEKLAVLWAEYLQGGITGVEVPGSLGKDHARLDRYVLQSMIQVGIRDNLALRAGHDLSSEFADLVVKRSQYCGSFDYLPDTFVQRTEGMSSQEWVRVSREAEATSAGEVLKEALSEKLTSLENGRLKVRVQFKQDTILADYQKALGEVIQACGEDVRKVNASTTSAVVPAAVAGALLGLEQKGQLHGVKAEAAEAEDKEVFEVAQGLLGKGFHQMPEAIIAARDILGLDQAA